MVSNDDECIVGLITGESLYVPIGWSYATVSINRSVGLEFCLDGWKHSNSTTSASDVSVLTYAYPPPIHIIHDSMPLKIQGLTTRWKHLSQWTEDDTLYPLFHRNHEVIDVFVLGQLLQPVSSRINMLLQSKQAWKCETDVLPHYTIPYPTVTTRFHYEAGTKDAFEHKLTITATHNLIVTVIGGERQVFLSR